MRVSARRRPYVWTLAVVLVLVLLVGCAGSGSSYEGANTSWIHRLTLGDKLAQQGQWGDAYDAYISIYVEASNTRPPSEYANYHALFLGYLRHLCSGILARKNGDMANFDVELPKAEELQNAAYTELERVRSGAK